MQRADVMVGMAWFFRILRWLPRWGGWSDDRFFPSCVHVLIETKQQPVDKVESIKAELESSNTKMEQLETTVEKLEENLNRQLENILKALQSTADRGPHISTYPEATTIGELDTDPKVTEAAPTLQEMKYIEAAAANDAVAAAEKRTADVVKQINVMNSTMKDTQYARLGAEKEATEMAKQIEVMQAEAARLAAENQATEMAEQIMQDEAARLAAQKQADEMAKQIGAMQAEAARLAAEKKATKPKETFF